MRRRSGRRGALALAAGLAPALAPAQEAPPDDGLKGLTVITALYACERGVRVPVTYVTADAGGSAAIVQVEGRQVAMRRAIGASGARYVSLDEQQGYRWWSRGDGGMLLYLAADHTADEETLLRDCREIPDGRDAALAD